MRFIPESWKAIEHEEVIVEIKDNKNCRTVTAVKQTVRRARHEEYEEQSFLQDDNE